MADKYGMTGFDQEILMANGVIGRNDKLKVLGRGELKAKWTFMHMPSAKQPRQQLKH